MKIIILLLIDVSKNKLTEKLVHQCAERNIRGGLGGPSKQRRYKHFPFSFYFNKIVFISINDFYLSYITYITVFIAYYCSCDAVMQSKIHTGNIKRYVKFKPKL